MEILTVAISYFPTSTLKTLTKVNKHLELIALRQLALNRWGSTYLKLTNKGEKDWYRDLIKLNKKDVNKIAKKGRLDLLNFLANKNILPTKKGANRAAANDQLEIVQWLLAKKILPTKKGANGAAANDHLTMLFFLEKLGILPDVNGANKAAANGHLAVLLWLEKKNIYPQYGLAAIGAAKNNKTEMLDWINQKYIFLMLLLLINWFFPNSFK